MPRRDIVDRCGRSGASLVIGAACLLILFRGIRASPFARFTLLLLGAISLFWFAGQLIAHAATNADDWGAIARHNRWPWIWRPIFIAFGAAAYAATMRLVVLLLRRKDAPSRTAIRLAYAASTASAVLAGLMWQPAAGRSAIEGLTTLGVLPLGLLFAGNWATRQPESEASAPIARSRFWIVFTVVVFAVFLLTQARGLGPLASVGLPR